MLSSCLYNFIKKNFKIIINKDSKKQTITIHKCNSPLMRSCECPHRRFHRYRKMRKSKLYIYRIVYVAHRSRAFLNLCEKYSSECFQNERRADMPGCSTVPRKPRTICGYNLRNTIILYYYNCMRARVFTFQI